MCVPSFTLKPRSPYSILAQYHLAWCVSITHASSRTWVIVILLRSGRFLLNLPTLQFPSGAFSHCYLCPSSRKGRGAWVGRGAWHGVAPSARASSRLVWARATKQLCAAMLEDGVTAHMPYDL